jgi:HD-GYP domain-containing protein (c-di-GMP phosphodiesterase class II)
MLATVSGGGAYLLCGGTPGRLDLPADIAAIAALAFVYGAVNTLLVNAVVAIESERSLQSELTALVRAEPSLRAAEAGLGATFAFFMLSDPWKAVFLFPLVLAVYQAQARLAALRHETAGALETFANVVDERDPYTFRHSARVSDYVRRLGEAFELPAATIRRLGWAGRLHDVGKIAVDARVLQKPGRLTESEWAAMRRHPRLSARLLRRFRFASAEARAVEYHHERFDGGGYYGIASEEQPLAAQFLVVADTYDAMTSDRPYRKGLTRAEALHEIEQQAGKQIHPAVARAFAAMQRGQNVRATLTDDEWSEVRRLLTRREIAPRRLLGPATKLIPYGAVVASLLAIWLGHPLAAGPALAVGTGFVAWEQLRRLQARRLITSLRCVLAASEGRDASFSGVVGSLAAVSDLRWAGLLSWREDELDGTIELEHALTSAGPPAASLTSWLIREADSHNQLFRGEGWELGAEGTHVALPLRRDTKTVGFLVLGLGGVPASLERALRETATDLSAALDPQAPATLGRPRIAVAR